MTSETEYDKRRHLQIQNDELRQEIKFLKGELELCQETTTKQSPR
jgi:hypothetical protein